MSRAFFRAQVSSIISTGVDWVLTFSLTNWLNVWYVLSTITGATSGGITNFVLNRHWTFSPADGKRNKAVKTQFLRYVLVWSCSILLNTLGTVFFTEVASFNYMLGKAITAITVAFCFNFFMQKNYVFRFTI